MEQQNYFSKKTAVVTGASSGLGRAMSQKLASYGATVFAAARNTEQLNSLRDDVQRNLLSGTIIPVPTDIRIPESIAALFRIVDERREGMDIVINNAAHGHHGPLQDISHNQLESVVQTNLMGSIYVTREAIQRMLPQENGHIVFISSLAGKLAFPELSVYSATKFGIEGLAGAVREELKNSGICVSVVRPGVIDTDFFNRAGMKASVFNKMQSPDAVAAKVLDAIAKGEKEAVIGPDEHFMPFLKHLPESWARRLLHYFS